MNHYTFSFGGQIITIKKSKQLVAIKKTSVTPPTPSIPPALAVSHNKIGDFEMIQLSNTNSTSRSLENKEVDLENMLDDLRNTDEVSLGTHVYELEDVEENKNDDKEEAFLQIMKRALPKPFKNKRKKERDTDQNPLIPTDQIYIVWKKTASQEARQTIMNKHALCILEQRSSNTIIAQLSEESTQNPIKIVIDLQASGLSEIAEPEFVVAMAKNAFFVAAALPEESLVKEQWHLKNSGSHTDFDALRHHTNPDQNKFKEGADAKVVEAWNSLGHLGSSEIVVAITDDGFDLNHPALGAKQGEPNTKIVQPWSFEHNCEDVLPKNSNDDHGTSCAGVAVGASVSNVFSESILGACPDARLMPIQTEKAIYDTSIEKLFAHLTEKGADVISCSWGVAKATYILSSRMQAAIHKAATKGRNGKGCIICFASGNWGYNLNHPKNPDAIRNFPTHPDVIAVGSSNSKDEHSDYSCYGRQIFVCAPSSGGDMINGGTEGSEITTATITNYEHRKAYNGNAYTHRFGGTSSACPLVAGICALILSAEPNLTVNQVKYILQNTADKIGEDKYDYDENGHSIYTGYGRINAAAAIQMIFDHQEAGTTIPSYKPNYEGLNKGSDEDDKPLKSNIPLTNLEGFMAIWGDLNEERREHSYYLSVKEKMNFKITEKTGGCITLYLRKDTLPDIDNSTFDWTGTDTDEFKKQGAELSAGDYYLLLQGDGNTLEFRLEVDLV